MKILTCGALSLFTSLLVFSSLAEDVPTYEDLNRVFALPLWSEGSLWEENADEVGERLAWPRESRTSTESSFRLYASPEVRVLGARPFSLVMLAEGNHPEQFSIVFANKGDAEELIPKDQAQKLGTRLDAEVAKTYKKYIRQDASTIAESLRAILGEPTNDRFGQGQKTREDVKRWDWKDSAILLAAPRDEYVVVRILPKSEADAKGKSRISNSEMREILQSKITHRDNGDVILDDIPMVNQGPKGYCVPATWERVMRYMGVPADMYVLAMAGRTGVGGGTYTDDIAAGALESIQRSGRRLTYPPGRLDINSVARMIDQGTPIMWSMYVVKDVNKDVSQRSRERKSVSDWAQWKESLKSVRKDARKIDFSDSGGHQCLIIGYNKNTREIAISDSWGPSFAERWMTEEELLALTKGKSMVISW